MADLGLAGPAAGGHPAVAGQRVRRVLHAAVPAAGAARRADRGRPGGRAPRRCARCGASCCPIARPGMAVLGHAHVHDRLERLLLAGHRAELDQPDRPGRAQQPRQRLRAGHRSDHGGRPARHPAAAPGVRAARPADRRRDHRTAPSRDDPVDSCVTGCRHRRPVLPSRLPLGRSDRGLPDRGRRRRGRPHAVDLGHLRHTPGRVAERRHRRRRRRPLPPLPRRRRADGRPGAARLPVLGVLAPDHAASGRRLGPVNARGWTSTAAGRRAAGRAASSRPSPSTTGTSRRSWRTRAAGPARDDRGALRRVRRASWPRRSATGWRCASRSTSRGAAPSSATPRGVHAPGRTDPVARARRRPPPNLAHGLAASRPAGGCAVGAGGGHPQPRRGSVR